MNIQEALAHFDPEAGADGHEDRDGCREVLAELVLEAERRRQAIDHLLRWQRRALDHLTDEQLEQIGMQEDSDDSAT